MKEFDLSDKEIKALLLEEGLEEPSMSFNRNLLSKIEAFEKTKRKPAKAPKWLVSLLIIFGISPAIYMFISHPINLSGIIKEQLPTSFPFSFSFDTTYALLPLVAVGVVWLVILFDKFLLKTQEQ